MFYVKQRTIFRQGSHISPRFMIMVINQCTEANFDNSLNFLSKNVFEFDMHKFKERIFSMKKN